MKQEIRIVDSQGRVTLGKDWAGSVVTIDVTANTITIRKQVLEDADSDIDDFLGGE